MTDTDKKDSDQCVWRKELEGTLINMVLMEPRPGIEYCSGCEGYRVECERYNDREGMGEKLKRI